MARTNHYDPTIDMTMIDEIRNLNMASRAPTVAVTRIPTTCGASTYCTEKVTHMVGVVGVCEVHLHELVQQARTLRLGLY